MKRDNKGFSLVELVVIIAIMAILIAALGVNLGLIKKYHAKECRQMIYSSLESGRLITLSKSAGGTATTGSNATQTYLAFFKNTTDNCNYYAVVVEGVVTDVKKISKSDVKIYFGPTNTPATPSEISSFTCLDSYACAVGKKNLSVNMLSDDPALLDAAVSGSYVIAYNRSTGGFLKDDSGNINLSIYANSGKYYYPIFLYGSTGKIQNGGMIKG